MKGQMLAFERFIRRMKRLDNMPKPPSEPRRKENPIVVKLVDEALAKWITRNFPEGFDFQPELRNLMVDMYEDSMEITIGFPMYAYLDAILSRMLEQGFPPLIQMRAAFILGIAFADLAEPENNPPITE